MAIFSKSELLWYNWDAGSLYFDHPDIAVTKSAWIYYVNPTLFMLACLPIYLSGVFQIIALDAMLSDSQSGTLKLITNHPFVFFSGGLIPGVFLLIGYWIEMKVRGLVPYSVNGYVIKAQNISITRTFAMVIISISPFLAFVNNGSHKNIYPLVPIFSKQLEKIYVSSSREQAWNPFYNNQTAKETGEYKFTSVQVAATHTSLLQPFKQTIKQVRFYDRKRYLKEKKKLKASLSDEKIPLSQIFDLVKIYSLGQPLDLKLHLEIEQQKQPIRCLVGLPHSIEMDKPKILVFATGKDAELAKELGADIVGGVELLEQITQNQLQFDRCLSTKQMFPNVVKIAKILGPKGLMPSPAKGTVGDDLTKMMGETNSTIKLEIRDKLDLLVGNTSWQNEKLEANIKEVMKAVFNNTNHKENTESLKQKYNESHPYKHVDIPSIINDNLLRKVRKEILSNLSYKRKETDIYTLNQSGDLANLKGLKSQELSQLESVVELYNGIYSKEFRDFVQEITGCGPLSGEKVDMAFNNYTQGCHLLVHDDMISTRMISFILYLVDSDWEPSDGGALELYAEHNGVPDIEPSKRIDVEWNKIVFFAVEPGKSFHSVEQVVSNRERLFHVAQEGEEGYTTGKRNLVNSTLSELTKAKPIPFQDFSDISVTLSKFINEKYLQDSFIKSMSEKFVEDSAIILKDFLEPKLAKNIEKILAERDSIFKKDCMPSHGTISEGWKTVGPIHVQRLQVLQDEAKEPEIAELLNFFKSKEFKEYISKISMMDIKRHSINARRFRPGLDYTLATVKECLSVTLNLSFGDWQDTFGGYQIYTSKDEGDETIYQEGGDDVLLDLPVAFNDLSIVLRDDILEFVKYVGTSAGKSRWDIECFYE
ncbi:hypothetical protein HDV06_000725 [Boothiomyces sp. JEL0866]|nr:hypothetical protein HDV06_000725 [Boothiomyces sp. JEL0866]